MWYICSLCTLVLSGSRNVSVNIKHNSMLFSTMCACLSSSPIPWRFVSILVGTSFNCQIIFMEHVLTEFVPSKRSWKETTYFRTGLFIWLGAPEHEEAFIIVCCWRFTSIGKVLHKTILFPFPFLFLFLFYLSISRFLLSFNWHV